MRRVFSLPTPAFGLEQIENYGGSRKAIAETVKDTRERHASRIYSKSHALLADVGKEIYSKSRNRRCFLGPVSDAESGTSIMLGPNKIMGRALLQQLNWPVPDGAVMFIRFS